MSIFEGAATVVYERSGDGNTAWILGAGDAVLASANDAGGVFDAGGASLMTAALVSPRGAHGDAPGADLKRLGAHIAVTAPDGAAAGNVVVRRFSVGPFSRKIELSLADPAGAEVGELVATDKKGQELAMSCAGTAVAALKLANRDRGLKRTVERWDLSVSAPPPAPGELLAAAAVLRYYKLFNALAVPS